MAFTHAVTTCYLPPPLPARRRPPLWRQQLRWWFNTWLRR